MANVEVLLMADVDKLGKAGDVVKVAPGYARNCLLPKDLAAPVSKNALRRLEKLRKEREEAAKLALAKAKDLAEKIGKASVTLREKSTDGTHLYGSVGIPEILKALETDSKITLDKSQLVLAEPFKEIGNFEVPVKLHADVTATLKVWIVEG